MELITKGTSREVSKTTANADVRAVIDCNKFVSCDVYKK